MYPENSNNKLATSTLVLLFLVVIVALVTFAVFQQKNSVPDTAPIATNDTTSLTPKTSSLPSFTGFDILTDNGLADDQLTGLKYAFGQYVKTLPKKVTTISLNKGTLVVVPRDPNSDSPNNTVRFSANLDQKAVDAEVDYSSLSPVELKLYDAASGATVFDSGVININTQAPTN